MTRWVLSPLAASCALMLAGGHVDASTMQLFSLESMCEMSDAIVQGEVVDAVAAYEPNGQIWTTYTIAVTDSLKSPTAKAESTITVKQVGGTVGDLTLQVPLIPHFAPGDELLLFTKDYGGGWQSVTNGPQGCLRVEHVSATDAQGRTIQRAHSRAVPQWYREYTDDDLSSFKRDVRAILEVQARSTRP